MGMSFVEHVERDGKSSDRQKPESVGWCQGKIGGWSNEVLAGSILGVGYSGCRENHRKFRSNVCSAFISFYHQINQIKFQNIL